LPTALAVLVIGIILFLVILMLVKAWIFFRAETPAEIEHNEFYNAFKEWQALNRQKEQTRPKSKSAAGGR
jgi:hypothetical protein